VWIVAQCDGLGITGSGVVAGEELKIDPRWGGAFRVLGVLCRRSFILEIHNALVISGKRNGVFFLCVNSGQFFPMHERYSKTSPPPLIQLNTLR
jgi:hypothetical protein